MTRSLLLCVLLISLISAEKSVRSFPANGDQAPAIELVSPSGGKVRLSSLRGKMVLVDFWASWCGPCRKENPNVVEAYKKYKGMKFKNAKGFEVLSASLDRSKEAWVKAIEEDGLLWKNHGWDQKGDASKAYSVSSIPAAFLIDGEGKIVAQRSELRGINLHLTIDKFLK